VKDPTLRHRLEYALVVIVRGVVGLLPEALSRALGTVIGLTFYAIDGAHRRLAIKQLRAAFPTREPAECRAIARATFAHFGRLLVALLRFSTFTPDQMRARVEFEGDDRVRAALAAGKGVIIVTGHFGYWELHGIAHALALPPMSVLARPLDNPLLHALLERARCANGNRVIYRQGAIRRVLRALAADEAVAFLIDQHIATSEAVKVDFFNRPVATTSAVATLALRTGATLVPAFALPLAGGRYRMIYETPVELPSAEAADQVRDLTQRCTDVLEMYVRRHPHLWLWMHRRWRDEEPESVNVPGMFPAAASDESEPAEP
jgi:Kdo2-lipid IVA lauroyltransferase/acyltransferase